MCFEGMCVLSFFPYLWFGGQGLLPDPVKSACSVAYLSQRVMHEESEYVETFAIATLESQLEPFPEYSV